MTGHTVHSEGYKKRQASILITKHKEVEWSSVSGYTQNINKYIISGFTLHCLSIQVYKLVLATVLVRET